MIKMDKKHYWEWENRVPEIQGDGIPAEEPARQLYYIERSKELIKEMEKRLGRSIYCKIVTFGCQMNARDSEKLKGILEAIGF